MAHSRSAVALFALALLPATLVLAMAAASAAAAAPSWHNSAGMTWARGCGFPASTPLAAYTTRRRDCPSVCGQVAGCTHFSWAHGHQGGRCTLAGGRVALADAAAVASWGAVCGVMQGGQESPPPTPTPAPAGTPAPTAAPTTAPSDPLAAPTPTPPPAPGGGGGTDLEAALVQAINSQREAAGLSPQPTTATMTANARAHSGAMGGAGRLYHQDIQGLMQLLGARGAAENVLYRSARGEGTAALAAAMTRSWMDSPGHRRNILNGRLNTTGCGVVEVRGIFWATCIYATL